MGVSCLWTTWREGVGNTKPHVTSRTLMISIISAVRFWIAALHSRFTILMKSSSKTNLRCTSRFMDVRQQINLLTAASYHWADFSLPDLRCPIETRHYSYTVNSSFLHSATESARLLFVIRRGIKMITILSFWNTTFSQFTIAKPLPVYNWLNVVSFDHT